MQAKRVIPTQPLTGSPRNTRRSVIPEVKSGIALSGFRSIGADGTSVVSAPKQTFLTSRFARVLLAGAGFLADAYDLFIINLVLRLLRDEYPSYAAHDQIHFCEGMVASAALVGAIIGQVVAGSLADIIGRKKIFVTTAILISLGSFGSATSTDASYLSVYANLSIWRFFLGLGVGGEYPLAATVTSESSSAGRRGALMAAVFSMQGVGALLSAFVVIACLSLGMSNGFTWRFALAFGAVPVAIAFPWRMQMHETETFERVKSERLKQRLEEVRATAVQHINSRSQLQQGQKQPLIEKGVHNISSNGGREKDVHSGSSESSYGSMQNASSSSSPTPSTVVVAATAGVPAGATRTTSFSADSKQSSTSSGDSVSYVSSGSEDYYIGGFNSRDNSGGYTSKGGKYKAPKPLTSAGVPSAMKQVSSFGSVKEYQQMIDTHSTVTAGRSTISPSLNAVLEPSLGHLSEIAMAFKYYKYHIVGTAACWFLLDVDFYANGLFNHDITASVLNSPGQRTTALQDAFNTAILGLIAVPGYWLSVIFIDRIGRKALQMMGFCMMGLLFVVCGFCYDWLMDTIDPATNYRKYIFLLLYALTFLFSNFGPNTTSFVIPGEVFPTEVRATCHGLSAACGKLGAAAGAYAFPMLLGPGGAANPTHTGIQNCMFICGGIAFLGALITFIFIPSYYPSMLAVEGRYLPLDFECLRPSIDELALIDESWGEFAAEIGGLSHQHHQYQQSSIGRAEERDLINHQTGDEYRLGFHAIGPHSRQRLPDGSYMVELPKMEQIIFSTDNYSMDKDDS